MRLRTLLPALALISCTQGIVFASPPASIAIIIDDIGINRANGERALRLPGDLTYAILPYGPNSVSLAEEAGAIGKEVILHMPMENIRNKPIDEGGLTHKQAQTEFQSTLEDAITHLPQVTGVSNHMGSYLTQQAKQMNWLMDVVKERHLFFIDSRTTPHSLAASIAREKQIPEASRDVFLDNVQTFYEIDREFQKLISLAKETGAAIGIGHPYETTLVYLEMALPLLEAQNIRLVPVSNLLIQATLPVAGTGLAHRTADDSVSLESE